MDKPRINPYLAVYLGVGAVSFSSLLVKLSDAPAVIIATYRLLFTFLLIIPFALKERPQFKGVALRQWFLAGLSGFFLAMHFITWFTSLKYTSVASSVVIVTTQPIFVVIGSFLLFKENITPRAILGGAMALGGSIYIGATDLRFGTDALWGDFLALTGAVLVSGYLIIGRYLRPQMNLSTYTFAVYGTSTLTLLLTAGLMQLPLFPYSLKNWLLFLGLAVVCTILGHTVFNWALRYVQASVVAVGVLGEPLGAIVWAYLFLGEVPSLRQIIGGMIIISGLYLFIRETGKS